MLQWFFENLPKISILTGLFYVMVRFIGTTIYPDLLQYSDSSELIMLVGVLLFIPFVIFDMLATRTYESGEVAVGGIVNIFALVTLIFEKQPTLFESSILIVTVVLAIVVVLFILEKYKESRGAESYSELIRQLVERG